MLWELKILVNIYSLIPSCTLVWWYRFRHQHASSMLFHVLTRYFLISFSSSSWSFFSTCHPEDNFACILTVVWMILLYRWFSHPKHIPVAYHNCALSTLCKLFQDLSANLWPWSGVVPTRYFWKLKHWKLLKCLSCLVHRGVLNFMFLNNNYIFEEYSSQIEEMSYFKSMSYSQMKIKAESKSIYDRWKHKKVCFKTQWPIWGF